MERCWPKAFIGVSVARTPSAKLWRSCLPCGQRCDRLRHARAVLPSWQDSTVHRCADRGRYSPSVLRLARSLSASERPRHGSAEGRGNRSGLTGGGPIFSRLLLAPYLKRVTLGLPFVIAKWAMSLDGKMSTRTGDSRWISGPESRAHAHQVRGRMDAIVVGSRTAHLDNPMLTARPTGARVPLRVVVDSQAALAIESQLVQTVSEAPVLVWASPRCTDRQCAAIDGCWLPRRPIPERPTFTGADALPGG